MRVGWRRQAHIRAYPELDELGELVLPLEVVDADELELEVLLEEAGQHPRHVRRRRLPEHLQPCRHCFKLSF